MAERDIQKANRRTIATILLVGVGMFGFGFVVLPKMYTVVCQAFGLNGQVEQISQGEARGEIDKSRTITVTFDANVNPRMPWKFEALEHEVKVHPGELKQVAFRAQNLSGSDIVGQATYSVVPARAAPYFKKTECFCFSQQPLASGESKEMPVIFMLQPDIPDNVKAVTLSYTFLRADKYAEKR